MSRNRCHTWYSRAGRGQDSSWIMGESTFWKNNPFCTFRAKPRKFLEFQLNSTSYNNFGFEGCSQQTNFHLFWDWNLIRVFWNLWNRLGYVPDTATPETEVKLYGHLTFAKVASFSAFLSQSRSMFFYFTKTPFLPLLTSSRIQISAGIIRHYQRYQGC